MATMNRYTGAPTKGNEAIEQALHLLFITRPGALVMNRRFGSEIPGLIDENITERASLLFYSAIATAIAQFEPRFNLESIKLSDMTTEGLANISIFGSLVDREVTLEIGL